MRVTKPMIERGAAALRDMTDEQRAIGGWDAEAEAVLRAALNDPNEPPKPIEGQMSVDDFPEAFLPGLDKSIVPGRRVGPNETDHEALARSRYGRG